MITLFTKKLHPTLRKELFLDYQRNKDQLSRILKKYPDRFFYLEKDSEVTELMLAGTVFYSRVIKQMESARRTFKKAVSKNITAIQMGQYQLTSLDVAQMKKVSGDFHRLFNKFGVNISKLDLSDMFIYAGKLNEALGGQKNE